MPHWRKIGRVFDLAPATSRSTTHAQVPTVLIKPDAVRVYFAARDTMGKSFPVYVDLARDDLTRTLRVHEQPVMDFGQPGTFDDEGIMPACVIERGDELWLYYSGWNRRVSVPYHNSTGLAVSRDGGETFRRKFDGPLLDRTPQEPYLAVTPSILYDSGAWRAWYISGLRWTQIGEKLEPIYVIKSAYSSDGVQWTRPNHQCIAQQHPLEAFSHPTVIKHGADYHMWYCYRHSEDYRDGSGSYRIGYARSVDGSDWQRLDHEAGIAPAEKGWDSTMQCYPYVIAIDDRICMFYNGNGFGQSGIGLATLEAW